MNHFLILYSHDICYTVILMFIFVSDDELMTNNNQFRY
jgi:hypothetical protein